VNVAAELRAWLAQEHDDAPNSDASARESNTVAERLLALTRALRPRRAEVAGCIVLHHPSGMPFAAACEDRVLVRADDVPAALTAQPVDGLSGWVAVDPWPPDITFARGAEVLRDALTRAFARASSSHDKLGNTAVGPALVATEEVAENPSMRDCDDGSSRVSPRHVRDEGGQPRA